MERATHGRVRRRIGHLGRWFGLVAGPRLFLIAVLLYVIFGCYVLTQVHDLQDRDVGVLSSIIGAAYVAVFIAVVEMTITYQKKLSMLKSQVQTPLRLLQRGIYLSAETVDHLFDTLAAGPGHEWTLTGIIDPRRAAAASRIYRVTGSSVELQPIVAEALHTLRIPTDPEARSLARWSAKGLTGKQSTEQWHTIVAAYVASTRCTPRTLELAGEWVSQPSSGPPPLEQLGASLSDEAPQP